MALTITLECSGGGLRPTRAIADRDLKMVIGHVTFDSLYASGGETLLPATLDLQDIYTIVFSPATSGVGGTDTLNIIPVTYDYTNHKVIAYGGSAQDASQLGGMAEFKPVATALSDLSSFTARFICIGY